MKFILSAIIVLCLFISVNSEAQSIAAQRALIYSKITTTTVPGSITGFLEGNFMDSIYSYILRQTTLQGVLNQGHTANTIGGNIADIKLTSSVPTVSGEFNGGAIAFIDLGSGLFSNLQQDYFTMGDGGNLATIGRDTISIYDGTNHVYLTSLFTQFKNGSNQTVSQLANISGRGELWLRPTSTNVLSKIIPTSTSNETFSEPDKGGAGGTFAMTSDIPNTGAQYTTSVSITTSTTPTTTIQDARSLVKITITAQAGSLLFNNPTGSWAGGQTLLVEIVDNGTPQTLTYGTAYNAGATVNGGVLPSTTISNKHMLMQFIYSPSSTNKFLFTGYANGY